MDRKASKNLQIDFIPSQPIWLLTHIGPQRTKPPGHPGFTLQSVTSFHGPEFHNYYGIICHLTPLRLTLGLPLCHSFPEKKLQERYKASPVKANPPVSNRILKHATGLIRYWASRYFARLPTRYAESGSLTLCTAHFLSLPSDPAVTSNALAIRIVFPLIRVTPA